MNPLNWARFRPIDDNRGFAALEALMMKKDPAEAMAAGRWDKVLGWLGVATIVAFALLLPAIAAAGR